MGAYIKDPTCGSLFEAILEVLDTDNWDSAHAEYLSKIKPLASEYCHDYGCGESLRYDVVRLGCAMRKFRNENKTPKALRNFYIKEMESEMTELLNMIDEEDDELTEEQLGPYPTTPEEIDWDEQPMPEIPAYPADVPVLMIMIGIKLPLWKTRSIH